MDEKLQKKLTKWHQQDKYDKIIREIERIAPDERDYALIGQLARAYNNRGDEGDYDRSIALLEGVRERGETDPIWHFRMGYAHYYADREALAAACFERVLELEPDDEDAKALLAHCYKILEEETELPLPELYEQAELDALEAHVERYFGAYESVFHEVCSPDIHVDILILPPTSELPFYTLMTQGMGAHRMSVPDALATHRLERAELLICLPPDWKLDEGEERWYWPMRWLKILARLPIEHETWLGWGHTVPNGEPFAENTDLCCMLLTEPQEREEAASVCTMPDGSLVRFYELLPLYESEMNYKLAHRAEELRERMKTVHHVIDIRRPNCCEGFASEQAASVLEIELQEQIRPFYWVQQERGASVCLEAGEYLAEVFDGRAEEGFVGNGYDWTSLATVFLEEECPELEGVIAFDPEAGMFCAYAQDTAALKRFILAFQQACEDREQICGLFSRAELD